MRNMRLMMNEIDRWFREDNLFLSRSTLFSGLFEFRREEDGTVVYELALPGVSFEDISLEVIKDDLVVQWGYHGDKYRRKVSLPRGYDEDKIQAFLDSGMLQIVVPPGVAKKIIAITSGKRPALTASE